MTLDEMANAALGRAAAVSAHYAGPRGPMFRRLGFRQRQLFQRAARTNPERFGTCAISALQTVSGTRVVDLNDINGTNAPVPEAIQAITIEDKGTSAYTSGDEVNVVSLDDINAELAPRCLLRDGLIIGVSTDLDLVTSLKIHYPRLPALYTETTTVTTALELAAPYDVLLELDLMRWIVQKSTDLAQEARAAILTGIAEEEKEMLTAWDAHCAEYTPAVSRFQRPRTLASG